MRYLLFFSFLLIGCVSKPMSSSIIDMSFEEVSKLAVEGNLEAAHALCYRYSYGYDGAPKNHEKAYEWCNRSSTSGNSSSITLLAELFFLGNGTTQSFEKAVQLYTLAAKFGHSHAQLMLYVMHSEGKGTVKNHKIAKYWLSKSAKNGNKQAMKLSGNSSI